MVDNVTILIVDDCEVDRESYRRHLRNDKKRSYNFVEAESAECGMRHFTSSQIDCILLDYSIPGQDGLTFLQDIKRKDPFTPVVMLTGMGNEKLATEAMKCGAQDYLSKNDVSQGSLKRVVRNALERAQMLKKIDEQKKDLETFANVLAHDLRSPINVIRGMNSLIFEALESNDYEDVADLGRRIERSARRMSDLIDTLQLYNKSTRDTVKFEISPLKSIVDDALDNLQIEIEQSGAVINCAELPDVCVDASQFVQLLQNIIGNAIKYNSSDFPKIDLMVESARKGWELKVKDNGIGIEKSDCEKVFQPFERLHNDEDYSGSGLGLATCRKIVERHGGNISCEPAEETGTLFRIFIPAQTELRFIG